MTNIGKQLFAFMGTFTNEQLDDAQLIASHSSKEFGDDYMKTLLEVLVGIRQEQTVPQYKYEEGCNEVPF